MPDVITPAPAVADAALEFGRLADAFVAAADRAVSNGATARIPGGDLERVITAAIRLYAAKAEAEGTFAPPVSAERITPTEVVMFVSEMLRAADLNLFDLAMWYRRAR
jgi:hypothetical protein